MHCAILPQVFPDDLLFVFLLNAFHSVFSASLFKLAMNDHRPAIVLLLLLLETLLVVTLVRTEFAFVIFGLELAKNWILMH